MDFKMRENVNITGFTFKKKVIEETISLIGERDNYFLNDIKFYTMICFTNELVEDNLMDIINNSKDVLEYISDTIEPFFKEKVLDNDLYKEEYYEIVDELKQYIITNIENQHTVTNIVNKLVNFFGGLSVEDITKAIEKLLKTAPVLTGQHKKDKEIKKQTDAVIENAKLKALMEQYGINTEDIAK